MRETEREIVAELGLGLVPNAFAWASEVPEVQTALWKAFRHVILRGTLPRTVKEMMGVVASRRAGSEYAARVHLHALMLQGVEEPLLRALERGEVPEGLPPKVAALLHFAHSAAPHPHDPALLAPLREAGLTEAEVKEAVATLGLFRMVNAWTDLLAIPVDAV